MAYPYGHPNKVPPGSTRQIPCRALETAVLVVDVQKYCSKPHQGAFVGTSRSDLPYFFDRVDETMVPNISLLLKAARHAGSEIIYTVIEALTLDGRDQSLDYKLSGPIFVPKGHPDAAVPPEIMPEADDIILPKTSCSVFCSTNIAYVLRNLGTRYLNRLRTVDEPVRWISCERCCWSRILGDRCRGCLCCQIGWGTWMRTTEHERLRSNCNHKGASKGAAESDSTHCWSAYQTKALNLLLECGLWSGVWCKSDTDANGDVCRCWSRCIWAL